MPKQKDAPKVNPLDTLFSITDSTTPAPMSDTNERATLMSDTLPQAEPQTEPHGEREPLPISDILATPHKPKKDKRLNLLLTSSLVEEMRAFCAKYGLSLNEGTARAYRFFIDNAEGGHSNE